MMVMSKVEHHCENAEWGQSVCHRSERVLMACVSLYSAFVDKNVGTVPAIEPGAET
jgi:hypothetical protein